MDKTMTANADNSSGRRWSPWKMAAWAAPALLMLTMWIAMQLTDEVDWSANDFVFAGVVLYGPLAAYEMVVRMTDNTWYRAGAAFALASAVMLVWGNGALGITDTDADGWYLGVLAVGVISAFIARFRAHGMALAMFAMALTMALVSVSALVAGMIGPNNSAIQIMGITGFYVAMFAGSAVLFREAAREGSEGGAE